MASLFSWQYALQRSPHHEQRTTFVTGCLMPQREEQGTQTLPFTPALTHQQQGANVAVLDAALRRRQPVAEEPDLTPNPTSNPRPYDSPAAGRRCRGSRRRAPPPAASSR